VFSVITESGTKIQLFERLTEFIYDPRDHDPFARAVIKVENYYETLRLNDAALLVQDFIWKEFCNWYLELSKSRIYDDANIVGKQTVKYVLLDILQNSMRLLQPLMPFISEEIWHNIKPWLPQLEESVVIARFPEGNKELIDEGIETDMTLIQDTITVIRNLRKQVNLSPGKQVKVIIRTVSESQNTLLADNLNYFSKLANVTEIEAGMAMAKPQGCMADVVMGMEVYLPLSGLIDIASEQNRLQKQLDKIEKELQKITGKLKNEKFIKSAPENIVKREQEKYDEVKTKYDKTLELLNGLK